MSSMAQKAVEESEAQYEFSDDRLNKSLAIATKEQDESQESVSSVASANEKAMDEAYWEQEAKGISNPFEIIMPVASDIVDFDNAVGSAVAGDWEDAVWSAAAAIPLVGTPIVKALKPKKTVKAYKLFRTDPNKPGELFPLFVNAKQSVKQGEWVDAEIGPSSGKKVKSKIGDLAMRPGWHSGDLPVATHIGGKTSKGLSAPDYRPDNQVWAEVEMPDDVDWQSIATSRADKKKNGDIIARTAHITDQLPTGGHYRYKTNSNMTGNWIIGGSMKVNKVLSDVDVKKINDAAGVSDLPRIVNEIPKFNQGGLVDAEMAKLNFSHGGSVHGKAQALDKGQGFKGGGLIEGFKSWVEDAVRPEDEQIFNKYLDKYAPEAKPEKTLVEGFKSWVEDKVDAGQQRVINKEKPVVAEPVVAEPVVAEPVVVEQVVEKPVVAEQVQPEVQVEVNTEVKPKPEVNVQTDEILSKATPDLGFVDEVLLDFKNSEGMYKHKSAEGGEDTGPYGLKAGMADLNMDDFTTDGKIDYKAAATSLLKIRVGQLNKGYPKFNSMPSSLKKTLLSTIWNQGVSGANELRNGINKAMELPKEEQGAAVIAIMKTDLLDGIRAMDDKGTEDKSDDRKRPMVGLMARKAADYNLTAQHYGLPLIASWDLVDNDEDYKIGGVTFREKATYYDEQGNVLKVHYKESRKHRNSSRAGSFKPDKVKSASVDLTNWAEAIT